MCSARALDQTHQLSSLRFAFYTARASQNGLGCLSRDCHEPVQGFTTVRRGYSKHHVTYSQGAPTAVYMWLYTTLKGVVTFLTKDINLKYLLFISER